ATDLEAVELVDGARRVLAVGHRDEAEAARAPSVSIEDDDRLDDRADLLEEHAQILARRLVAQRADEEADQDRGRRAALGRASLHVAHRLLDRREATR